MRKTTNMDPETTKPQGQQPTRDRIGRALALGIMAFVLTFAFMRWAHPYLIARHPERIFVQCGVAALVTSVTAVLVSRLRDPRRG